jgi:hypothetical protein
MARDYIALEDEVAPDSFDVEITPEIGGELGRQTRAARAAVTEADNAQRRAAAQSRAAARSLREAGLSGRDIAAVLRVSPQRVSQLLKPSASTGDSTAKRSSAAG